MYRATWNKEKQQAASREQRFWAVIPKLTNENSATLKHSHNGVT